MTVSNNASASASINVTPLIDVLLVLLIIFMAIAPTTPLGLPAAVPDRSRELSPSAPDPAVVVEIAQDLSLTVNRQPVAFEELGERLAAIFNSRAEKLVFVQGHPDLDFRHVARAIDVSKGAGISRVGLMPKS